MATEGRFINTTLSAGEDLNSAAYLYHAIALDDGKLAVNGEEASGILLNEPKSGEGLTLGTIGEMKFAAGGAISKGDKLTVATSGWFTSAGSGDVVVGECKAAVTSGSLGTGLFAFPNASARDSVNFPLNITTKKAVVAGVAIDISAGDTCATGVTADAVVKTAANSGGTAVGIMFGQASGTMAANACCSLGDPLTITTSGYFTPATSGYVVNARALANIGSASSGRIFWLGNGGILIA